jgi:hypothetical protein
VRSTLDAPSPTGLAALPADEALDAVATALARSAGVRVSGTVTSRTGGKRERVRLDVHLVRGTGGRGTVSPPDSTMQVIVIGSSVYLTGDDRFLRKAVGATHVAAFRGRYVTGTTGTPLMAELATRFDLLDYAGLLPSTGLRPGDTPGRAADGTPTVTYTGPGGATLVVTDDEADPRPLHWTGPAADGPVDLGFAYEEPVTLKKPPRRKLAG